MKKIGLLLLSVCFLVLTGCQSKSDIGIKKIDPDIDFSVSRDVTVSELTMFADDYIEALHDGKELCKNHYEFNNTILSYSELSKLMEARCNYSNKIDFIYDDIFVYLNILGEENSYATNDIFNLGTKKVFIEFNDHSMTFMTSVDDAFFVEFKLLIIDDELYLSYIKEDISRTNTTSYTEYVLYENHYLYYSFIDSEYTSSYVNNYETGEYYHRGIDYNYDNRNKNGGDEENVLISFESGDGDMINRVQYMNDILLTASTFYYKDDKLQFEYTTSFEGDGFSNYKLNPLLIDNWTTLRKHPTINPLYNLYDGDVQVLDSLILMMAPVNDFTSPFVSISIPEELSTYTELTQLEVEMVRKSQEDFIDTKSKIFRRYNIDTKAPTYEDYIKEFDDLIDYIDDYHN